jgi:multidrug efflux pump subunit AcrA (membrane-fusion protein)
LNYRKIQVLKENSMTEVSGKKTTKKLVAFVTTAIVALGLLLAPSLLVGDDSKPPAEEETPVYSVKTEAAGTRTLRSYLTVNGDIVSDQQVRVFPEASGKLASVKVALGSVVRRGELIAEVNPSRPGLEYQLSPVYAPISGTVSAAPLAAGSTVGPGDSIATISVIENLQIEALIPERDVSRLRPGLKANVTLQAWPGEVFTATITKTSPVLDPASRTKKIVLAFDKDDARINAGMFARVALNTGIYANILTVPSEAVIDHFGTQVVYVLRDGGAGSPSTELRRVELREVATGVTIGNGANGAALTEIKAGLAAGEQVITSGQQFVSDGAAVRVIAGSALPKGSDASQGKRL